MWLLWYDHAVEAVGPMGAGRGEALVLHCHWLTAGDQHQDKPLFVHHRQSDSPPMVHTYLLRGSVSLNSDCLCVSEVVVPVASCFSSISISMEVRSYHRTHDSDCSFANACSSSPALYQTCRHGRKLGRLSRTYWAARKIERIAA